MKNNFLAELEKNSKKIFEKIYFLIAAIFLGALILEISKLVDFTKIFIIFIIFSFLYFLFNIIFGDKKNIFYKISLFLSKYKNEIFYTIFSSFFIIFILNLFFKKFDLLLKIDFYILIIFYFFLKIFGLKLEFKTNKTKNSFQFYLNLFIIFSSLIIIFIYKTFPGFYKLHSKKYYILAGILSGIFVIFFLFEKILKKNFILDNDIENEKKPYLSPLLQEREQTPKEEKNLTPPLSDTPLEKGRSNEEKIILQNENISEKSISLEEEKKSHIFEEKTEIEEKNIKNRRSDEEKFINRRQKKLEQKEPFLSTYSILTIITIIILLLALYFKNSGVHNINDLTKQEKINSEKINQEFEGETLEEKLKRLEKQNKIKKLEQAKKSEKIKNQNKKNNIQINSKITKKTQKIKDYYNFKINLYPWTKGQNEEIKKIQIVLQKKGYYNGKINGIYDKNLLNSIKKILIEKCSWPETTKGYFGPEARKCINNLDIKK